ncbi:MAG: helix-turn-helix domain-containing protein [Paludibacteraceae bacterium]|nr:helix-turn-helix domain-containing protein [Paludibacteraceae bacterium]
MKLLLAIQLMSYMVDMILCLLLFICPYTGPGFQTYNRSRKMQMYALLLISIQYILQMFFNIRANSEELGTTCNLFFYVPGNILFLLSALNLQQKNKLKKSQIWTGIVGTLTVYTILLVGLFTDNGQHINIANQICGMLYLFSQFYFSYLIFLGYKRMVRNIDDFYGSPVEMNIEWMRNASILLFICLVCVPFAIFSTKALLLFSFLFWTALAYYVFNFAYFGHYVKLVEEAEEKSNTTTAPQAFVNLTERTLQPNIENWIKEKKYCDSDITIVKLANEIGTNRTTLSKHINTCIGKSFREWINDLRIQEAKTRMKEDPMKSIEDIAIGCGFSTRKYFDQVFCNHEQETAAEWRKKLL